MTEVANKPADKLDPDSLNAGQGSHDDNLQQFRTVRVDQGTLANEVTGVGQDYPKLTLTQDSNGNYRWQALPAAQPDFDPARYDAMLKSMPGSNPGFDQAKYDAMQESLPGKAPKFDQARFDAMQEFLPGKAPKFDQVRFDILKSSPESYRPYVSATDGSINDIPAPRRFVSSAEVAHNDVPAPRTFPSW